MFASYYVTDAFRILPGSLRYLELVSTIYAASLVRKMRKIYRFHQSVQLVISELRFARRELSQILSYAIIFSTCCPLWSTLEV